MALSDEEDFLERHWKAIAKVLDQGVIHHPLCSHGKRVWLFNWRWPFVHTWISTAICICDVNAILSQRSIRRMQHNIDDIVAILDGMKE